MSFLRGLVCAKLQGPLVLVEDEDEDWQSNKLIELGNADIDTIDQLIKSIVSEQGDFFRGLTQVFKNYSVDCVWYLPQNELDQNKLDLAEKKFMLQCLTSFILLDLANIVVEFCEPVINVKPGLFVDVLDSVDIWTLACIKNVYEFQGKPILHISYLQWKATHDEYVSLDSDRVKMLYNYKNEHILNFNVPKKCIESCGYINAVEIRYRNANSSWRLARDCPLIAHYSNRDKADLAPLGIFCKKH